MTQRLTGWRGCLVLSLLMLVPAVALADEQMDEGPAWLPFIELGLDLHKDQVKAELNNSASPYEGKQKYHDTPPSFNIAIGLLAPPLDVLPGRPRPYLDVGVLITPETKFTVFERGSPDNEYDDPNNLGNLTQAEIDAVTGQGSSIVTRHENPLINAGIGMQFTLPWLDRRIRLKGSAEYEMEKVEIVGTLKRLTGVMVGIGAGAQPGAFIMNSGASKKRTHHSVGFGLEAEWVVTGGLSIYLEARALWLLGDDKLRVTGSDGLTEFVYNRNDVLSVHGGFGARYSFIGL